MAVPTITSVTPTTGHAGGATVLRIVGTGFQVEATPASSGAGPIPVPPAPVRVFLGGTEARRVRVASSTVLYVTTERHDPGVVALEVRNVGPFGETIGAELVSAAAAFTYARPIFTTKSDVERVIRTLHAELVRQVFPEVVLTASVDWNDPLAILRGSKEAPNPCVFLAGPTFRPNGLYKTNERTKVEIATNVLLEHRAPVTDDLVFTLGALADKYATLLGLASALRDFKLRNPWLHVLREEGGTEFVRYDLSFDGDFTVDSDPDSSDIRTCSGSVSIDGVDTLGAPGFVNDQGITANPTLLENPELESEPTTI